MQDYLDKYYNIIADNFKELRSKNNLSQEKFAERISCSREYVSRVENYKERLGLEMLLKISFIFDVKPDYFFNK